MIISFSRNGKGQGDTRRSGEKALGYLLGTHDHTGAERAVAPVLMSGDPDVWNQIVTEGNHPGRYTSGSLNFAENQLSDEILDEIIEDFERALLPSLDANQYSSVWIKHEDKGRTELHFLVAGEELTTGKRLNAYYHAIDMRRLDAWKTAINAEYNFIDPDAPENKRAFSVSKGLPRDKQALVVDINNHMTDCVDNGTVKNRKDVIEELELLDLKVARETKSSISIYNPTGGQNIRLKGAIYERDFQKDQRTPKRTAEATRAFDEARERRAKEARRIYEKSYQRRSENNQKRYSIDRKTKDLPADSINNNGVHVWRNSRASADDMLAKQDLSHGAPRPPWMGSMPRDSSNGAGKPADLQDITTKKEKGNGYKNTAGDDDYLERIRRKRREKAGHYDLALSRFEARLRESRESFARASESTGRHVPAVSRYSRAEPAPERGKSGMSEVVSAVDRFAEKIEKKNRKKKSTGYGYN